MSRAQQSAQKDGDAFVQSIQRQVDAFGLSGNALLRYQAGLKGVSDAANPLIDRLERLQDAQAAFNASASGNGLQNVGDKFSEAANGAEKASHGSSGLTRELIVLGHEVVSGNYTRLGGSLLVIARYSETAVAALRALMGPLGLLIAALALVAFGAISGAEAFKKQQDALQLTGNYAGQTATSLRLMSEDISRINSQPIGHVNEALQAVVASGRVSGDAIKSVTAAAVSVAKLTGQSAGEVAKQFSEMTSNVGASAAKALRDVPFPRRRDARDDQLHDRAGPHVGGARAGDGQAQREDEGPSQPAGLPRDGVQAEQHLGERVLELAAEARQAAGHRREARRRAEHPGEPAEPAGGAAEPR